MRKILNASDNPVVWILTAIAATGAAAVAQVQAEQYQLAWMLPISQMAITAVLIWVAPEEEDKGKGVRALIFALFAGFGMSLLWIAAVGLPRGLDTRFPSLDDVKTTILILTLVNTCLATPLFEEKIVRHLMLTGVQRLVGRHLAVVITSLAFALPHIGSFFWAFAASVVLCYLKIHFKFGLVDRTIAHGVVNLMILSWYFSSGFGIFAV